MRLIDADVLKVNVARMSGDGDYVESVWYDIDRAPTVDVPDMKVGKWIYWDKNRVLCSVCKLEPYAGKGADNFKYCPNCGAKMEEEQCRK